MTSSMRRALNIVANCFGGAAMVLLVFHPANLTPIAILAALGVLCAVSAWFFPKGDQ